MSTVVCLFAVIKLEARNTGERMTYHEQRRKVNKASLRVAQSLWTFAGKWPLCLGVS